MFYKYDKESGQWTQATSGTLYTTTYSVPEKVVLCQRMTDATEIFSETHWNPCERDIHPLDGTQWSRHQLDQRLAMNAKPPEPRVTTRTVYQDRNDYDEWAAWGLLGLVLVWALIILGVAAASAKE